MLGGASLKGIQAACSSSDEALASAVCSREHSSSNADTTNADIHTSRADTSKADTSRADTSKADTSRADTSKADASKADTGSKGSHCKQVEASTESPAV